MRENAFDIYKKSVLETCPQMTYLEWLVFRQGLHRQELYAKEYFLRSGEVQGSLGFITKGLIRAYYLTEKGQEITTIFVKEGEYATDYPAFLAQTPAFYDFQCLEDTELVLLPYAHMQRGYDNFAVFNRYGRLVGEKVITILQSRLQSFLMEDAEERYLAFLRQDPELFNRISLTHLASYLGIDRSSLSRIRKKIAR